MKLSLLNESIKIPEAFNRFVLHTKNYKAKLIIDSLIYLSDLENNSLIYVGSHPDYIEFLSDLPRLSDVRSTYRVYRVVSANGVTKSTIRNYETSADFSIWKKSLPEIHNDKHIVVSTIIKDKVFVDCEIVDRYVTSLFYVFGMMESNPDFLEELADTYGRGALKKINKIKTLLSRRSMLKFNSNDVVIYGKNIGAVKIMT